MPTLTHKKTRRFRIHFSMTEQLWKAYQENVQLAKRLNVDFDFIRDFEPWFKRLNQTLKNQLEELASGTVPQNIETKGDHNANN